MSDAWTIYTAVHGFVATAPQPSLWAVIAEALRNNPLLTIIGWSLATFGAGFTARRYFQDRELNRTRDQLLEAQGELSDVTARLQSIQTTEAEARRLLERIADCITPAEVKRQLAGALKQWPKESHDLVVAGVVRQLIATPGRAWLCTPSGSTFLKMEWDEDQGACRVRAKSDSSTDPIKELREFVRKPEALASILLDLSIYGIISVARSTTPTEVKVMKVRQGPRLDWHVETNTLERVPAGPEEVLGETYVSTAE